MVNYQSKKFQRTYGKKSPYSGKYLRRATRSAYSRRIARAVSGPAFSQSSKVMPLFKTVKQPFVENMMVKLKYHTNISLSSSAGAQAVNTFNLNSVFDCDATNVGHQPRYYDQLFASGGPYLNYRVLASKIKVQFMNDNTSAGALGYVGIFTRTSDASVPNDIDQWGELPNMKYKLLPNMYSGQPTIITKYVNIARQLGVKDIGDDEDAEGAYNGDPVDLVKADIIYRPLDEVTTTSIYAVVDITYVVQCCDLQTIAKS